MKMLYSQINKIKKGDRRLIFAVLGTGFFLLYAWLYLSTPAIFNSPDENATWVFAQQWASTGGLTLSFSPNPQNVIRPRSVNIIGTDMVPGGFLGLILLVGMAARISDLFALSLPALLAVGGIFAFYSILKRVFDEQTAFLSMVIAFFLPPWWHFSSKGFLPNVPFLSFLLIALALFLSVQQKKSSRTRIMFMHTAVSGIALGCSLMIRPSEFWWIALAGGAGLVVYRQQVKWRFVILTILFGCLPLLFSFAVQADTYGNALNTGYEQYQNLSPQTGQSFGSVVMKSLFPFGAHPIQALKNFANFGLRLFWWLLLFWVPGMVWWFKKKSFTKEQFLYTSLFFFISVYLILYYGSWSVRDDLDAERISIGVSYIRYWLPIFLGLTPFMTLGLHFFAERFRQGKYYQTVFLTLFAALVTMNTVFVFWGKDGLREIRQNVVNYTQIRKTVDAITAPEAVIINERNDKLFWPSRQVIQYEGQDYSFVKVLPDVMAHYPVLWLTILPDSHVRIWEQREFASQQLMLEPVDAELPDGYRLYQVLYR